MYAAFGMQVMLLLAQPGHTRIMLYSTGSGPGTGSSSTSGSSGSAPGTGSSSSGSGGGAGAMWDALAADASRELLTPCMLQCLSTGEIGFVM